MVVVCSHHNTNERTNEKERENKSSWENFQFDGKEDDGGEERRSVLSEPSYNEIEKLKRFHYVLRSAK